MNPESWLDACSFNKDLLLGVENVINIKIHMVCSDHIFSALNSISKVLTNLSVIRSLLPNSSLNFMSLE